MPLVLDRAVVNNAQLVNLAIVLDKLIALIVPLVVPQVQVPLHVLNVALVLMHLARHCPHAVNVLLEHILPLLEQLVVMFVMQDLIPMREKVSAQLVHKVITLQVRVRLHVSSVLQATFPLVLGPEHVTFVLQGFSLLLDQVAALSVQQEAMLIKLEVVNALIVQLGDLHQELDQQVVKPALQEPMLHQDQLPVPRVTQDILLVTLVVKSASLVLLEHIPQAPLPVRPALREVILSHLDLLFALLVRPEVSMSTVPQPAVHAQQESISRIPDKRHVSHVKILHIEHPLEMQQYVTYLAWVCCNVVTARVRSATGR